MAGKPRERGLSDRVSEIPEIFYSALYLGIHRYFELVDVIPVKGNPQDD